MDLEGKETLLEFGQGREIVGRENLSLNDGEIDLDLIEPTGVDRRVDENGIGPFITQTVGGFLASVSGAVVHDPKDPSSGLVGLLAHDLGDEPIHGSDTAFHFAAAKDLGAMDIPGGQVGPGTFAEVFVLDTRWAVRRRRQRWLFTAARLNAGLFVCGNAVVIGAQWRALPNAFVKIKDGSGLVGKVRIARKDPASMLPRSQRITAEPAPQSGAADLCDQALRNHMLPNFLDREPGQGKAERVRKFAGQSLNLNDEAGGKSGLYARPEAEPPGQAVETRQIACAIC